MEQFKPIYAGPKISDTEILGRLPKSYRQLLNQTNGFILFSGGLHVRGAVISPAWHSLRTVWFGDLALSKLFPVIKETDIPFAQDCLGDQFVLRSDTVYKIQAEIGEIKNLGINLVGHLTIRYPLLAQCSSLSYHSCSDRSRTA